MLDQPNLTLEDGGMDEDGNWQRIARETYSASKNYYETNFRKKWEHAQALFKGEHPPGSKYYGDAYKHRSRLFRPKTRSNLRRHEAAAASAFFSSSDALVVEPGDDNLPLSVNLARAIHWLINMRLRRTIPWFQICMGAYQTSMVQGAVASKCFWCYEEDSQGQVKKDKPEIRLLPLENLRFDPDADWTDPVGDSPYVIEKIPMYAGAVRDKMAAGKWKDHSLADILAHGAEQTEDEEAKRRRTRRTKNRRTGNEFTQVWVREYIVRVDGRDMVWLMLGDTLMLTDPEPLNKVYLHGRPYRLGYSMLEAFNPLPDSLAYTGRDLQAKANDIDNQRNDNVRLALNKRYFVRRGARVDEKQLYRSVPGGAVRMNDPNSDVRWDETRDVTASAYAEQDRVNADYDELTGSFSTSSVLTNRKLNETVGGMERMNAAADVVTEYQLKTFAETWVEPVLNQLAVLEQKYETDPHILRMAGNASGLRSIPYQLLENEVVVSINVGMGATDPMQRVRKFMMGLDAVGRIPNAAQRIKEDEVIAEVFSRIGYKDGLRFFNSQEEMREMQQSQRHPQVMAEQIKAQEAREDREFKAWEVTQRLSLQKELGMLEMSNKYNISMSQLHERLADARAARVDKAKTEITKALIADKGNQRSQASKMREMALKERTGEGI